ncbi:MAG: nucleotidyltransferase domain-containing protein [Tepidisphaeraceae bacterium]
MIHQSQITKLAEQIVEMVHPERIILFGSYAYGTPDETSDVDLLIIVPFEGRGSDAAMRLWDKLRPAFSVELLVRRPDDTARRYEQWDPLIREALDKGKVLYERNGEGVDGESGGRLPRRRAGV